MFQKAPVTCVGAPVNQSTHAPIFSIDKIHLNEITCI